jgi:hypothetical protein
MQFLCLLLAFVNVINLIEGHVDWNNGLDRLYIAGHVLPEIGRYVGDGNVLEVGVMDYNVGDAKRANVSPKQWYFVDYFKRNVSPEHGTLHISSMDALLGDTTNVQKFRVIYDYGVLGFTPKKWGDYPASVDKHIAAYPKLLETNGRMYLKFDLNWPRENIELWPEIRKKIAAVMEPVHSYLQMRSSCGQDFGGKLLQMEQDNHYTHGFRYNFTAEGSAPARGCDCYLYTVWRNSLSSPNNTNV